MAGSRRVPPKRGSLQEFTNDLANVVTKTVRDDMNIDVHAFIVNKSEFSRLVRQHLSLVRKVAARSTDESILNQLKNGYERQAGQLASKLYTRFLEVLDAEILNIPERSMTVRVRRQGKVSVYVFEGRGRGTGGIYNAITKNVLFNVKKKFLEDTKLGSIDDVLAAIISGVDLENPELNPKQLIGGEYGQASNIGSNGSLFPGNPVGIERRHKKTNNPTKVKINKGAGIQLGHNRGPDTVTANKILDIIKQYYGELAGSSHHMSVIQGHVDAIHEFDAEVRFNNLIVKVANGILEAEVEISTVSLESAAWNAYSGGQAGDRLKLLRTYVEANKTDLFHGTGSRSIEEHLFYQLEELWETGKTKTINLKGRTYKARRQVKGKITTSRLSFMGVKDKPNKLEKLANDARNIRKTKDGSLNLQYLLAFLNRKLHDKIQENMGKGKSKKILNYQTGRFAKSARIKHLLPSREIGAINATVKYMRQPYGVFEKGGHPTLATPGRDPAKIFGRSIRQLLQEERIVNLRRVKVTLRG